MRNVFWSIVLAQVLTFLFAGCAGGPSTGSGSDDVAATPDDDGDDDAGTISLKCEEPQPSGFAPAPSNDAGVFVSAETGDDENPGTMAEPKRTLAAALRRADEEDENHLVLFLAAGEYVEIATSRETGSGHFRVLHSVFGGYESRCWTRDLAANKSVVEWPLPVYGADDPLFVIEGITMRLAAGFGIRSNAVISRSEIYGGYSTASKEYCTAIYHDGGYVALQDNIIVGTVKSQCDEARGVRTYGYLLMANNLVTAALPGLAKTQSVIDQTDSGYMYLVNNMLDLGDDESAHGVSIGYDRFGPGTNTVVFNDIWPSGGERCLISMENSENGECTTNLNEFPSFFDSIRVENNVSVDPLYDPDSPSGFRPLPGSPLIDGGATTWPDFHSSTLEHFGLTWEDMRMDIDGEPRPYHSFWDIGPYEWRP